MNSSATTNLSDKELHEASNNESRLRRDSKVGVTIVSLTTPDNISTILIDSSSSNNDLTITPAFPNFSTDKGIAIEPESVVLLEPSNEIAQQEDNESSSLPTPISSSTQRNSQLFDEITYLLKPTNSLATPDSTIQASQEVDTAIKRRTLQFDDEVLNNIERPFIDELTPSEAKSLDAARRRSIAAHERRSSSIKPFSDRSRTSSMQPSIYNHSLSKTSSPTILITLSEHRTFSDHLPGFIWAFLAAFSFSIILFLTKMCGIDLIFGFFLQMAVQTIGFGIYAFYKGYNLLGPSEHRIAMISRAVLIGIGALTSFLAYYYITLPEISAIRQSQVVLAIVLSIFFLHQRVTITRIFACILTLIAILILIRPTTFNVSSSTEFNFPDNKTPWIPYSSSWNYIIGISLVLCTAITHSLASTMNKMYSRTQHLHNTVLGFWSALLALIISFVLVCVTHFVIKDVRSFPHDWRLFVGFALALASGFVFIANQKAIKRTHPSIVTLIYSTDIILTLILQNIFTQIKSDTIIMLGCLLILISILIICIELFIIERNKKPLAIKLAEVANTTTRDNDLQRLPISRTIQKRVSF